MIHYRNDVPLRFFRKYHYDYKFQPNQRLRQFIHFIKNDKLSVICEYNSMGETKTYTVSSEMQARENLQNLNEEGKINESLIK